MITCDDALYSLREQVYSKKEEVKATGVTQVGKRALWKLFLLIHLHRVLLISEKRSDCSTGAVDIHSGHPKQYTGERHRTRFAPTQWQCTFKNVVNTFV